MDEAKKDNSITDFSSIFASVPIEILVSVGRARPMIKELLTMGANTVLPLDRKLDDPVELYVGDRLIALGELEELSGDDKGKLVVRLIEVTDSSGNAA
jgi:flagellar motor switch protein FliN